jgi:soluble lytic murein transglycosylase-like protein
MAAQSWHTSALRLRRLASVLVCSVVLGHLTVAFCQQARPVRRPASAPFSTENEKCIVPASMYHGVNYHVLRAILRVESGLNPLAVGRNKNGSIDVGMGGTNSSHFRELAKFGLEPGHLRDPCVSTYVAAWHLKKVIAEYGNTWTGIARYNSGTPYFNRRYQIMLKNELVRAGVLAGAIEPVPPLTPGLVSARSNSPTSAHVSMIVADAPSAP